MPISITLQEGEIQKLRAYMRKHRLTEIPVKSIYETLRVKDGDIGLILYKSGKLVYEDNAETGKIIRDMLEAERGYDFILGTDEAGKGEWYGPLVVECAALTPGEIVELKRLGVRDSKSLNRKRLLSLGGDLIKRGFIRKHLILMPGTYNRVYGRFRSEGKTLNDLMAWAHARAIKDLIAELEYNRLKVVIDKFDAKRTDFRLGDLDKTGVELIQKTGGESEIPVATASILAKYLFEGRVDELDGRFDINLRKSKPGDIPGDILPYVAKLHFKNVRDAAR